jgi:hypothetical protein
MPKFSHLFELGFSVETDNDAEHVTADELWAALRRRLDMRRHEIIEACGLPIDTEGSDGPVRTYIVVGTAHYADGFDFEVDAPNEDAARAEATRMVEQGVLYQPHPELQEVCIQNVELKHE